MRFTCLFFSLLLCLSAFGQGKTKLEVPKILAKAGTGGGGGGACAVSSILDDTDNDSNQTGAGVLSQSITVSSTITVCKVRLKLLALGNDSTAFVSFRTAPNGGGSLVGTASQTIAVTSAGGVHLWMDFTWTSNPSLAAGTYYLTITEGTFEITWGQESGNNGAGYTGGDVYVGASANVFRDFTFEVWTQ